MDTCQLLNQLIAIHARSLPVYLTDASPWMAQPESEAQDVLNIVAADQLLSVDRLADLVMERGGAVSQGSFPMEFTGMHDLSLDYLVTQLVEYQARDVVKMEGLAAAISGDARAKALAEECLGAGRGHLESFQELRESVVA